jgi:hypothetical protein
VGPRGYRGPETAAVGDGRGCQQSLDGAATSTPTSAGANAVDRTDGRAGLSDRRRIEGTVKSRAVSLEFTAGRPQGRAVACSSGVLPGGIGERADSPLAEPRGEGSRQPAPEAELKPGHVGT